ncbi:TPA: hypothetical protein N0F65_002578 [Lagenidium giganteum]|uniref:Uncharacterized protein n=1 Tax=Lagenidium giganteum TaxID=4803 RepID=A0AAV2YYJ7_9STRA|nr:TPA: hypothetical protein N0F65_002578 [Lagenidium giganteum]
MRPTTPVCNERLRDDNYYLGKALAIVAQMLSSSYQAMIREARSARDAWVILRVFFVKRKLHNRIQLRKELYV